MFERRKKEKEDKASDLANALVSAMENRRNLIDQTTSSDEKSYSGWETEDDDDELNIFDEEISIDVEIDEEELNTFYENTLKEANQEEEEVVAAKASVFANKPQDKSSVSPVARKKRFVKKSRKDRQHKNPKNEINKLTGITKDNGDINSILGNLNKALSKKDKHSRFDEQGKFISPRLQRKYIKCVGEIIMKIQQEQDQQKYIGKLLEFCNKLKTKSSSSHDNHGTYYTTKVLDIVIMKLSKDQTNLNKIKIKRTSKKK
jgi:hypothetical protein